MSEQWDGRPPNPEQSGMHLLRSRLTGYLTGWYWNAATERFHHEHITLGRTALLERYVYEGPILTPAEIAAQVEAARREGAAKGREQAARIIDDRAAREDEYSSSHARAGRHFKAREAAHVARLARQDAAAIRARGDALKETGHE